MTTSPVNLRSFGIHSDINFRYDYPVNKLDSGIKSGSNIMCPKSHTIVNTHPSQLMKNIDKTNYIEKLSPPDLNEPVYDKDNIYSIANTRATQQVSYFAPDLSFLSNQATALLHSCLESIKENNLRDLEMYLDSLDMNRIPSKDVDKLLHRFLTAACEIGTTEMMNFIIDYWDQTDPDMGNISTLSRMFISPIFEQELLNYIVKNSPTALYTVVMEELIKYGIDENNIPTCSKIDIAFSPIGINTYGNFWTIAKINDSPYVAQFLEQRIRALSEYAPIPEYVKNFTTYPDIPLSSDLHPPNIVLPPLENMSDEQFVLTMTGRKLTDEGFTNDAQKILLQYSKESKENDEVIRYREQFRDKLILMPPTERKKYKARRLMNFKLLSLEKNPDLFRLYGPANAIKGRDLFYGAVDPSIKSGLPEVDDEGDECTKYGGCRMLLCNCFEKYDDDNNYDPTMTWFKGACDYCFKRIADKSHAVREPMEKGGWIGCYCSLDCLRKSLVGLDENMFPPVDLTGAANFRLEMVNILEEQLNDIGIQNRRYVG